MVESERLQKETLESLYPEFFNAKVEKEEQLATNEEELEQYIDQQALQVHEWM